jgi:hypothetical protein
MACEGKRRQHLSVRCAAITMAGAHDRVIASGGSAADLLVSPRHGLGAELISCRVRSMTISWRQGSGGSPVPAGSCLPQLAGVSVLSVDSLRRALAGPDAQQALELLLDKTRETSSNLEFLAEVLSSSRPRSRRAAQVPDGTS